MMSSPVLVKVALIAFADLYVVAVYILGAVTGDGVGLVGVIIALLGLFSGVLVWLVKAIDKANERVAQQADNQIARMDEALRYKDTQIQDLITQVRQYEKDLTDG